MKLGIVIGALIGLVAILGYVNFADGAVFIKFDGIDGEATDSNHDKWIDVLSVNWGATKPTSSAVAAGSSRETAPTIVAEFSFTKEADKSSPKIFLAVANGENLNEVVIDFVKTGSSTSFLKWTLTDAIVTSYSISSDGDTPLEHISINFVKVKYAHTGTDTKTGEDVKTEIAYDLEAATKVG